VIDMAAPSTAIAWDDRAAAASQGRHTCVKGLGPRPMVTQA